MAVSSGFVRAYFRSDKKCCYYHRRHKHRHSPRPLEGRQTLSSPCTTTHKSRSLDLCVIDLQILPRGVLSSPQSIAIPTWGRGPDANLSNLTHKNSRLFDKRQIPPPALWSNHGFIRLIGVVRKEPKNLAHTSYTRRGSWQDSRQVGCADGGSHMFSPAQHLRNPEISWFWHVN